MERTLRNGEFAQLEQPNTEFLKSYGTHLDNGKSAERVHEFLVRLARPALPETPEGI